MKQFSEGILQTNFFDQRENLLLGRTFLEIEAFLVGESFSPGKNLYCRTYENFGELLANQPKNKRLSYPDPTGFCASW